MNRVVKRIGLAVAGVAAIGLMLTAGAIVLNRVPLTAPPGPWQRLSRYLGHHVAQTSPGSRFPELRIRRYPVAADVLFADVERAVQHLGWTVRERDPARRELRAVVVTPLLGFRDDILIRVNAEGGHASSLYLHSQSRVGRGDLGANTRHILDLYAALRVRQPAREARP